MMVVHPWQESDIVTLLSWLDFCIAHDVNFWESIIPKLQESRLIDTNQDFSFTRRQIQNKLIGLCRQKMSLRFDSRSHPKLSDVVSRGSACIPGLTQDMLTKVKNAVFHLEKKYRQGAYRTGIGKNEHDRGSIVEKQGSESSLSRLPKTSNTRLARIRLPTLHGSQAQNLPSPSKTTQESRALTNGHGFHDTGLGGDYMSLRIIGQESQAARISTLEEKNQRLAEEIQLLHNARNDREAASHDLRESDFYTFYRDGWDMKQRLASMQRTINFHEKLVPLWKDSMSYGDIDEEMGMIEAELQSISHCLGTASLRRDITVATGGLLESLIQSAFRVGSVMKTASEIWREILSLSDSLTALNTLVLVAIRDWILNTLFPVFEDGSLLSALFKSWRTVLLDCAGASLAHSLEATAYSQFIDSNAFKDHLIPEQAAILADRFIEASFPIFPLSFGKDAVEFFRERLIAAFTTAYHFKASTVLMNSRRYQLIIGPPKSPEADLRTPVPHSTMGRTSTERMTIGRLNVYNTIFFNQLNRQANALLDSDNFVLVNEAYSPADCIHSKDIRMQDTEWGDHSVSYLSNNLDISHHSRLSSEDRSDLSSLSSWVSEAQVSNALDTEKNINTPRLRSPSPPTFVCSPCNKSFTTLYSLERHRGRKAHLSQLAKHKSSTLSRGARISKDVQERPLAIQYRPVAKIHTGNHSRRRHSTSRSKTVNELHVANILSALSQVPGQ